MCNEAATVVVDARGITKRFGELNALRDVSMTVRRGEIHGLLGPNGAGKTTLLRILLGLVRRDRGHIRLFDRDVPDRPARVADGVGAVLEGAGFYPYLSGRRNLRLVSQMDDISMKDGALDRVLARVGLARDADRKVAGYSAGMRQRLALAAALLREPALLLLDEPTSALDPAGARDVCGFIAELAAAGTTVILSSHDLLEVERLCASVTILRRGEVVFSGPAEKLHALAGDGVHALVTSDDAAALTIAAAFPDVRVIRPPDASSAGFAVSSPLDALDRYVVALGRAGIAVRLLQPRERSLETVFLQMTMSGGVS